MNKLGNFTIILSSYNCDKHCPFCIAKNNKKFNGEKDDFSTLSEQLDILRKSGIKFERIVLSGNGEPSLYDLEELKELARIIKDNKDLFDTLRIHSSGNIFWESEKFELFNGLVPDVEFDLMRASIIPEKDMQILGYDRDYTKSECFKKAKRVKFDIALTNKLEVDAFPEKLEILLHAHPNIGLIRFKNLMNGENEQSKQATWVRENRMSKSEFMSFTSNLLSYYGTRSLNSLSATNGTRIVIENTGNYPRDVVYSRGLIRDYTETPIDIQTLQKMSARIDNTRVIRYDDR